MNFNTAETFFLIIQHPEKQRFMIPENGRTAGLIGAILLDLNHENKIKIENNRLIALSHKTELSSSHKNVLEKIYNNEKTRKTKIWISKLRMKSRQIQKDILLDLEKQKLIEIIDRKFLFFKYYQTRLINTKIRNEIINQLRSEIFSTNTSSNNNSMIIGLVEACQLYRIICNSRQERKLCRTKVKEILASDEISQGVSKVIQEMQAAIIASIAASSAVAASAGS